jgi:predicted RND superfamily exporter protein
VVRDLATEDFATSRVFVRMRETAPTLDRSRVLRGLRESLAAEPSLAGLDVKVTGIFLLYANMLDSLIASQRDTFLLVIGAVWTMLLLLFRSPVTATLVLLPQALPVVVVLGAMGWLGVPLDLVTVMIASIAMGVGIDSAIQYAFRFRTELAVDGDRRAAVRRSHASIGRAIWIATTVIVAGFAVLLLSDFRPSVWFGLFTAIAMAMSQVSALTVLPALFVWTGRPRPRAPGAPPAPS